MANPDAVPVDPSNLGALQAWDGREGEHWADQEAAFDESLRAFRASFFAAAAIGTSDRVLDIGCGNGQTTRHAARVASEGSALGVDLSAQMLARARQRAVEEGVTNVEFRQADAQVHPFDAGAFDVAISRAGTMFFGDPLAAFGNIARSLRDDGRLTMLVWQSPAQNEWFRELTRVVALEGEPPSPRLDQPGPFSLADPARTASLLEAAGFADVGLDARSAPLFLGATVDAAMRFVCGLGFIEFPLRDLDDGARARVLAAVRASIEAHATPDGVQYPAAVWIVTARRT